MPVTLLRSFDVSIPAGTLPTSPLVTATAFEAAAVDSIEWTFPDGCNGVVGVQFGARGVPVLPDTPRVYLVRSGSTASLEVDDMPTNGDWSVIGYNTGAFTHVVHVAYRIHRHEPEPAIPPYLASDLVDMMHGGTW